MDGFRFYFNDVHRENAQKRKQWEQSLKQESYSVPELAKALGYGKNFIYTEIEQGRLNASNPKERRRTRVSRMAVVDYLEPEWSLFNRPKKQG
jgi:excisionase family DNA binding protein